MLRGGSLFGVLLTAYCVLRCYLRRWIAPPALAGCANCCNAEPVTCARSQTVDGRAGFCRNACMLPTCRCGLIAALFDDVALRLGHGVPGQINLTIMITGTRAQRRRQLRH